MRVRARYTKAGKVRYVSAIDLGRIWERALRQADLPIAYSEGFSPHPKVSFPDALPLGYASLAEYVELEFAGPFPLAPAVRELNAAFPTGIDVRDTVELADGAPRLAKWLRASVWELAYDAGAVDALDEAAAEVLAAAHVPVARDRKGEVTEVDLRPALHDLRVALVPSGPGELPPDPAGRPLADDVQPASSQTMAPELGAESARVRALVHHVEPPMRPSEVHAAIAAHVPRPWEDALELRAVTRVAQGELVSGGLREAIGGTVVPPQPEATHRE